jgi:hypothetical protein
MAERSSFTFSMTVFGEAQVLRRIDSLRSRARSFRPVFEAISRSFRAIEKAQFATEGRSGSRGWAPLKEATRRYKARHKPPLNPKILHATNRLRDSLVQLSHPDHYRKITKDTYAEGSQVAHGEYHQRARPPRVKRKPVDLTEEQRRSWVRDVQHHAVSQGRKR